MVRNRKRHRYELYQGDALEWLKKRSPRSIHAVVTDPPYSLVEYTPAELEKKKNGKGIWRLPHAYDGYTRSSTPRFTVLGEADHLRIREFHRKLAPALFRVLVPGGHVIMASQTLLTHLLIEEFVAAGFELRGQIARIVKTLRGGDRPKGAHKKFPDVSVTPRSSWEPWLVFRRPCVGLVRENLVKWKTGALRRPSRGSPFRDLIVAGPARKKERKLAPHPSVKPQVLMRQLVAAALPLGRGVILDPFMGCGSTIAAAQALSARGIGIEINESYFKLAKKAVPELATFEVSMNGAGQASKTSRRPKPRISRSKTKSRGKA